MKAKTILTPVGLTAVFLMLGINLFAADPFSTPRILQSAQHIARDLNNLPQAQKPADLLFPLMVLTNLVAKTQFQEFATNFDKLAAAAELLQVPALDYEKLVRTDEPSKIDGLIFALTGTNQVGKARFEGKRISCEWWLEPGDFIHYWESSGPGQYLPRAGIVSAVHATKDKTAFASIYGINLRTNQISGTNQTWQAGEFFVDLAKLEITKLPRIAILRLKVLPEDKSGKSGGSGK